MKGLPYSTSRGIATSPVVRKVQIPVKNVSVTVAAAAAGVGFGTVVIGDFPRGNFLYLGGCAYLQFFTADTDLTATWAGSYGIGTAPDADGTLAAAEINLISTATIAAATARLSPVTRGTSAADASEVYDNTTTGDLEINLNVTVGAADITDATSAILTVNGIVELVYVMLGDDAI